MLNLIFVVAVFVDCFEILVCSPTSYMLWSLYVWHSEMVIHPLALSEIPQHQTAFHLIPEKHRSGASRILGVFRVSVFPDGRCHTKNTAKTQETSVLLSYMSMNKMSSIIFQFATTLKRLDVNILVLPNIQQHSHTHTDTHWLAVANWWLAQESTTFSCSCPHSTDSVQCQPFFSSLGYKWWDCHLTALRKVG